MPTTDRALAPKTWHLATGAIWRRGWSVVSDQYVTDLETPGALFVSKRRMFEGMAYEANCECVHGPFDLEVRHRVKPSGGRIFWAHIPLDAVVTIGSNVVARFEVSPEAPFVTGKILEGNRKMGFAFPSQKCRETPCIVQAHGVPCAELKWHCYANGHLPMPRGNWKSEWQQMRKNVRDVGEFTEGWGEPDEVLTCAIFSMIHLYDQIVSPRYLEV